MKKFIEILKHIFAYLVLYFVFYHETVELFEVDKTSVIGYLLIIPCVFAALWITDKLESINNKD